MAAADRAVVRWMFLVEGLGIILLERFFWVGKCGEEGTCSRVGRSRRIDCEEGDLICFFLRFVRMREGSVSAWGVFFGYRWRR